MSQGAKGEDPLLTAWDLDTYATSSIPLASGQALAVRLQTYLVELRQKYPWLRVNPAQYGMHSLRRGGVVAAWAAGVNLDMIMAHGRWTSSAVKQYLTANTQVKLRTTMSM
jgi:hypothetical protein